MIVFLENIPILLDGIRQAYIELYINRHYLKEFHGTLLKTLKDRLGINTYDAKTHTFIIPNVDGKQLVLKIPKIEKVLKYSKYFVCELLIDSNYILLA